MLDFLRGSAIIEDKVVTADSAEEATEEAADDAADALELGALEGETE